METQGDHHPHSPCATAQSQAEVRTQLLGPQPRTGFQLGREPQPLAHQTRRLTLQVDIRTARLLPPPLTVAAGTNCAHCVPGCVQAPTTTFVGAQTRRGRQGLNPGRAHCVFNDPALPCGRGAGLSIPRGKEAPQGQTAHILGTAPSHLRRAMMPSVGPGQRLEGWPLRPGSAPGLWAQGYTLPPRVSRCSHVSQRLDVGSLWGSCSFAGQFQLPKTPSPPCGLLAMGFLDPIQIPFNYPRQMAMLVIGGNRIRVPGDSGSGGSSPAHQ